MRVQISSRHTDVPEDIRARAEEQVAKLTRYDPNLRAADIVFEEKKRTKSVDAILHINGSEPKVAKGEGDNFSAALDQLVERLGRMLRRSRAQRRDHQGPKLSETTPVLEE